MIEFVTVGKLSVNCWIIPLSETNENPAPCIVIDPGADAPYIIARLETLRLYPRYILLTHGHFDHTGAIAELLDYFHQYKIELALHPADAELVNPETRHQFLENLSPSQKRFAEIIWAPMPLPHFFLHEGDEIGPFTVMCTPGHSAGSVCFFDEARNQLFSGDTLFAGGIGRSDGLGGSPESIGKSLKRLLLLDADIEVFPGHGPSTTIGKEFWMKDAEF